MIEWILDAFLGAAGDLLVDLWLYMVLGFLVAGVVEEFVSNDTLLDYFGKNSPLAILRGVLAGFVVSACSCGAIPLVAMLRDRGASTATTLSFLLASPWLGIPMLLLYVSFLGWPATFGLVLLSLTVAFITGLVLARLERAGVIATGALYPPRRAEWQPVAAGRLSASSVALSSSSASVSPSSDPCSSNDPSGSCSSGHCAPDTSTTGDDASWTQRLFVRVPRHAWSIARDIGLYLGIGVLLAAVAKAFIPPETITTLLGRSAEWWAPAAAVPISAIIEACSEGFAVVAGQLHQMGASLAVVFVITMVGVATDYTELSVLWGTFGTWTTGVYLALGTTMTLLASFSLQFLL